MATKSIVGLEQPVRRLYSERLFYVFSGVFMVLSVFFPKLYIPFYLLISVVGYWLTRVRLKPNTIRWDRKSGPTCVSE